MIAQDLGEQPIAFRPIQRDDRRMVRQNGGGRIEPAQELLEGRGRCGGEGLSVPAHALGAGAPGLAPRPGEADDQREQKQDAGEQRLPANGLWSKGIQDFREF